MGESSQQLIKKLYEERLENLKKDYADVFAQLNSTDNVQSRNHLQRQLDVIEQDMNRVEQKLESILQTEVNPYSLLQFLTPYFDSAITSIQRAYQASCPQGFSQQVDTIEEILEILQDIKGDNTTFSPIARFVAHLVIDSNIPQTLHEELQIWGENNIQNFDQLLQHIQTDENIDNQNVNSYLLIRVQPKTEKKLDRFYIYAWLIPDIQNYNPKTGDGCRKLSVSKSPHKSFTLEDIPKVVDSLLEESSYYFLGKLTVEFFLPYKLLNHTVDTFPRVEFDTSESIGKKYRVVVRANERLQKNYPYKRVWLDKWQKVKRVCDSQCRQGLVSSNHSQAVLRRELDQAIGIILTKIPKNTSNETIFSFILMTATPIALWVRKEIKVQNVVRNALLDCCIFELPDKVKEKRLDAPEGEDDHVGNNLSLLWEDPERLTPDAGYFYSIPQSVS